MKPFALQRAPRSRPAPLDPTQPSRLVSNRKRRRESGKGSDEVDRLYAWGGIALLGVLLAVLSFMLDFANIDVWTGTLTAALLIAASVPIFRWIARADDWPGLHRWLLAGLAVKLLMSLLRYWFIFRLNGGNGDAGVYLEAAGEFAQRLRLGLPLHPLGRIANFPKETQYVGDVTGVVFYLTGASRYAAFMVFSWFCYIGQVLSVRALRAAIPEADHRRYMLTILFLPSLLFWPSSVGKEAILIFNLGVLSYGAALLLAPKVRLRGIVYFVAGTAAIALIRPHIALMAVVSLVAALGASFVSGREDDGRGAGTKGRSVRLLAFGALGLVAVLAIGQVSTTFSGNRDGAEESTQEQLDKTARQTSIGKSAFKPVQASSALDIPAAVGSVVFRPFLWEGGSGALIAAIESSLLIVLLLLSLPRLRTFPALVFRRSYLLFSVAFVVVFSVAFSYIGNFGILARQRVQMFPALLVLMALPTPEMLRSFRARSKDREELPEADLKETADTLTSQPTVLKRVGARPQL